MKKSKLKIEVEVWDIKVDERDHYKNGNGEGWYYFNYSIRKNNGQKKLGEYNRFWSDQTKEQITRVLKNGYAARLVLELYL